MSTTYYPWNVQALIDWLKLELSSRGNLRDLATALDVPPHIVSGWIKSAVPTINLQHIRCIAQYRGWSVQQTSDWLQLKPAHVEELIEQDPLCGRVSWDDAKALWFGTSAV